MSVLLETSAGEIVIDLFVDEAPLACKNFLKLCKIKYYHGCLFYNVQPNYIVQCGDPTGTGKGGMSVFGKMYGDQATMFEDEINLKRKLDKLGLVCMANTGPHTNKSQFFITLRGEDLQHLHGKHTVFGEVAEGFETLKILNGLFCDESGRPFQDVRVKHSHVLDDPYPDPPQLEIPPSSPTRERPVEELVNRRIPFEESLETVAGERSEAELEQSIKRKEAQSRAIVLEMTGDIPDADVKPPEEVLFVCKLNPITTDEDLELIFSRFGKIKKCEIIRDFKTGDSLNYAFIEFETEDACLEAYEKMNNVLIDDRRIKVDFSQSVTKLWNKYLQRPAQTKATGGGGAPSRTNVPNAQVRGPPNKYPVESRPQLKASAPKNDSGRDRVDDERSRRDETRRRDGGDRQRSRRRSRSHSSSDRRRQRSRSRETSSRRHRESPSPGRRRRDRERSRSRSHSPRRNHHHHSRSSDGDGRHHKSDRR
jgi:peptidyl-prolyl cis-trans isomerase-like 4